MLSEKAEALVNELVDKGLKVSDILHAIEIAKDEQVRVVWQRIVARAEKEIGDEKEFKRMASLGRKMFMHHAEDKIYPWTLSDLREGGIADKTVEDYLSSQTDPDPKSKFARPRHT